ncbi:hypothetical protein [Pseudomonas putida]|jgi:hypothetical protein|uniref:hypothetical protein n=1 Tax=Pseudomonas putida TaxID=303 RepID=UPI000C9D0B04|nr:hypothetical protein [Pseudomonas putida]
MFRTNAADIAGVPGMFGDGLAHWHGVSRALATHWYHVSVKRWVEDRFVTQAELLNDEPRLHEVLEAQCDQFIVEDVQVVTPARLNGSKYWRMERLTSLAIGFDKNDCPVCLLEVESGGVYNNSCDADFDRANLSKVRELYRAPA